MIALLIVALLIFGIICVASPETAWQLTKGWQYKDAEPSDAALIYMRVIGVAQIIFAIYILLTI